MRKITATSHQHIVETTEADHNYWNLSGKKKLAFWLMAVFVFFLWYRGYMNLTFEGSLTGEVSLRILLMSLGFCLLPILGLFFFNTLFVFYVTPKIVKRLHGGPILKILLDFSFSWIAVLAVNGGFLAISWLLHKNGGVEWLQTIVVNLLIYMLHEVFYFLANYREASHRIERQKRMAAQLEYNILRSQVSPHFLFNSLNILYSLLYIDTDKSREFTLYLSRMYHYIMAHHHSESVSVKEEMDFLNSYVEVLKTMYNDSLNVNIELEEGVSDKRIVPYSLQLLMENVIKHNVIDDEKPMDVNIRINNRGISMTNMIIPKKINREKAKRTGIGMKYLNELYALNGGKCSVEHNAGTYIVTIPYLKEA